MWCSNERLCCWGLYSPPGIPPGIRLESWNSAGLITEFDILAESAQNIMGIGFVLLCLVIPYRVWPHPVKKKKKSMECPVDFHGTSPRWSCDIIHVMISCANLNMIQMSQHVTSIPFFNQPPTTTQRRCRQQPRYNAQRQPQLTSTPPPWPPNKWSWPPTNEDSHPHMKMNHDQPTTIHHGSWTMASSHVRTWAMMSPGE